MINIINDFYSPSELGLMTLCFLNYNFSSTYQSKEYVFTNRSQAYPSYETDQMEESDDKLSPYQIFKNTFSVKIHVLGETISHHPTSIVCPIYHL